jgi:hypothetical protein
MFKTVRDKLLVGLTPLLAIIVGLGVWAVAMLDHLGGRIDVILRENYEGHAKRALNRQAFEEAEVFRVLRESRCEYEGPLSHAARTVPDRPVSPQGEVNECRDCAIGYIDHDRKLNQSVGHAV